MKTITFFSLLIVGMLILGCGFRKEIYYNELPSSSILFLKKYFSEYTASRITKDPEHGEKGFEVTMQDGTEVEFWHNGKWREVDGKGKPIPTDFISEDIVNYVKQHYPNEQITHIDYGHKDVDVDLTNKIDLEFDKEGKFLKAD